MNKDTIVALSFRLGKKHRDRLRELSRRGDVSQTQKIRTMIDKEHKRVFAK